MIPDFLRNRLERSGVVAVLVLDDPAVAVPVARALQEGGVHCLELTLRTPGAMEALKRVHAALPDLALGAGTVLTPRQVQEVVAAGATFAVAPGLNPRVVAEAQRLGLPFAPGVCTPSDIELAVELGCRVLKFFPAEPSGGLGYLKAIAAPFAHLDVKFIPLGGLTTASAAPYLKEPSVLALGGSWLATRESIAAADWAGITQRAREVTKLVHQIRGGGV